MNNTNYMKDVVGCEYLGQFVTGDEIIDVCGKFAVIARQNENLSQSEIAKLCGFDDALEDQTIDDDGDYEDVQFGIGYEYLFSDGSKLYFSGAFEEYFLFDKDGSSVAEEEISDNENIDTNTLAYKYWFYDNPDSELDDYLEENGLMKPAPNVINRDVAIELLSDYQLEECKKDFVKEDFTVMFSFIDGSSKSYNLLTNEELKNALLEDLQLDYESVVGE